MISQIEPKSINHSINGTRWAFRSKLDGEGKVIRNKGRLVAQDHNQHN